MKPMLDGAGHVHDADRQRSGPRLKFAFLQERDLFAIERQESQLTLLGEPHTFEAEEAALLCAQPVAWVAREGTRTLRQAQGERDNDGHSGRIVACFGIVEMFPGRQGWGWAVLAKGIGTAHFELTRFVQGQIAGCGLARLELRAVAAPQFEQELAATGRDDPAVALAVALRHATPEIRWAVLLGLNPVHVLRQYGADGAAHVLFERINVAAALQSKRAA